MSDTSTDAPSSNDAPTVPANASKSWRWWPLFFSATLLAFSLYPLSYGIDEDSFPLSSYPMFSHGRPSPMLTLTHAVGVRGDGTREPLAPMVSAGNREVLQSMMTIELGLRANAAGFCDEVAQRAAADAPGHFAQVEILTESWDTVAYFEGDAEGRDAVVHIRCEVPAP